MAAAVANAVNRRCVRLMANSRIFRRFADRNANLGKPIAAPGAALICCWDTIICRLVEDQFFS